MGFEGLGFKQSLQFNVTTVDPWASQVTKAEYYLPGYS